MAGVTGAALLLALGTGGVAPAQEQDLGDARPVVPSPPDLCRPGARDPEVLGRGAVVPAEPEGEGDPAVRLVANFINFTATNPSGGVDSGKFGNTAQLQAGADVAFDSLGWKGTRLRFRQSLFLLRRNGKLDPGTNPPDTYSGGFWAQDVGSTLAGVPFPNFIPRTYLSELTVAQRFASRVDLQVGRMNPMNYFDTPDNCEAMLSCQNPVNLYDNLTLPPAFATWGARMQWLASDHDTIQAGIYQDYFASNRTSGFDWSFDKGSGAFIAAEFAHKEDFKAARLPVSYTVGAWHDTSAFSDPATGHPQRGSVGVYGRAQRALWRDGGAPGESPARHVMAFATFGYSPSSAQPYRGYAEIGMNVHGMVAAPLFDFVGAKIAYLRVSDSQIESERTFRLTTTGIDVRSANDQFRLELNGRVALSRTIRFEPSVQYVINPNVQFNDTRRALGPPRDGLVLAGVLYVNLTPLLN